MVLSIPQKLERGMYSSTQEGLEDMRQDLRRIIRNAMKYYRPGTAMYTNARHLMDAALPNVDQFVDDNKCKLVNTYISRNAESNAKFPLIAAYLPATHTSPSYRYERNEFTFIIF